MPGDPPCHFYVQLVQPAPAKIAKNLQKIQSFKKIFKKKNQKILQKTFFSIFPKWHYFNFAISILVFVAIKMHLLKRHLRRYLYFIFIQKLFQWCIPCRQRVFIGYRLFKLMIDQSELTFNDAILDLKNRKPLFSNFTIFCEISNEKTHKAKVFLLNVWNSFANKLLKCWNFAKLVFYILLSCQMSHAVLPRLDLTVWLTAVWLFDSHLNRIYRGKLM